MAWVKTGNLSSGPAVDNNGDGTWTSNETVIDDNGDGTWTA